MDAAPDSFTPTTSWSHSAPSSPERFSTSAKESAAVVEKTSRPKPGNVWNQDCSDETSTRVRCVSCAEHARKALSKFIVMEDEQNNTWESIVLVANNNLRKSCFEVQKCFIFDASM